MFKNKVITSKVCYRHLKGLLLNRKCNYNLTLYFLSSCLLQSTCHTSSRSQEIEVNPSLIINQIIRRAEWSFWQLLSKKTNTKDCGEIRNIFYINVDMYCIILYYILYYMIYIYYIISYSKWKKSRPNSVSFPSAESF